MTRGSIVIGFALGAVIYCTVAVRLGYAPDLILRALWVTTIVGAVVFIILAAAIKPRRLP